MCRRFDRILNYSHPEPAEGSNEIQAPMPTDRTLQVQETSPNTLQEYCHPELDSGSMPTERTPQIQETSPGPIAPERKSLSFAETFEIEKIFRGAV
jgi:hypothetical protein